MIKKKTIKLPNYNYKRKRTKGPEQQVFFKLNITPQKNHNSILNPNIKHITNVYKLKYINLDTTGFGDFIRGCYFLLEFCEKHNINLDFYIHDNCVKNYLKYFINKPPIDDIILNNISKFNEINCKFTNINNIIDYTIYQSNDNKFIDYLNDSVYYSEHIFINTVNFPSHNISQNHLNYMRQILEPTNEITTEVNSILNYLYLNKYNYITYQIRLGDEYLNSQSKLIDSSLFIKIVNKLNINKQNKYLVISDSLIIKKLLKKMYPTIRILTNKPSHIIKNDNDDIKNTLIEFYLMSYSQNIVSFSVYPHGSGFSKWCAVTYNIPYICYLL